MQSVGVLLLAAGASTRLGQPKQLLPFQGKSLLRRAAETASATGCGPVVLVTGALHDELLPEVAGLPVAAVRNLRWADGMSSSIAAGLAYLEARAPALEAVLVLVCDQPLLTVDVLQQLIARFQPERPPVVASAYAGVRGVPALFSRALFGELRQLSGPAGARELLHRYSDVAAVDFPGGVVDVDTMEQYNALVQHSAEA
ncbi:nucleotidyltransferase family protein [Hymenobacter saemangeumensis]|uniref:Nucleotidyltransferase family protein n=1 Tax=Hymenobacter saemangeumensis TaxID=1084522 RepID=A0ABP8IB72_9BACT